MFTMQLALKNITGLYWVDCLFKIMFFTDVYQVFTMQLSLEKNKFNY